jgi:hypothetical protein
VPPEPIFLSSELAEIGVGVVVTCVLSTTTYSQIACVSMSVAGTILHPLKLVVVASIDVYYSSS